MTRGIRHLLVLTLAVAFGTGCQKYDGAPRYTGAIDGVDVSHYQAGIDWQAVRNDHIEFAFVKATEGREHRDVRFCANWDAARSAGIYTGAYHFFRPGIDARVQADNFSEFVDLQPGDLPPVLDIEVLDGVDRVEMISAVRDWLYLIEIRYQVKPIIYTSLKFYYQHLVGHFEDYPLWVARYGDSEPRLGAGADYTFWQYANTGRVEGISGDVDLNLFQGTWEDFETMLIPEPVSITMKER